MARHYVKILGHLRNDGASLVGDGDDWADKVFRDVTENGSRLQLVELEANMQGPRVGLCGDIVFCEAGFDRHRDDTFFITSIYDANERLPETEPKVVDGEFYLLSSDSVRGGQLDFVYKYFPTVETEPPPSPPTARIVRPSPAVISAVSQADPDMLPAWRPRLNAEDEIPIGEWLPEIRRIFGRYRLDRYMRLSTRSSLILAGTLKPDAEGLRALLAEFDIGFLNNVARHAEAAELNALLADLSRLGVDSALRAGVWAAVLNGLSPTECRRELHVSADILVAETEDSGVLEVQLFPALRAVASEHSDGILKDVISEASLQESPLRYIGNWASTLQFSTHRETSDPDTKEVPAESEAGNNRIRSEGGEAERPGTTTIVEAWVFSVRMAGTISSDQISRELKPFQIVVADAGNGLKSLEELRDFIAAADGIAHLKSRLPKLSELENDVVEFDEAYEKVRSVLGNEDARYLLNDGPTPEAVLETVEILRNEQLLNVLPGWVFARQSVNASEPKNGTLSLLDRGQCLLDPDTRAIVKAFEASLEELGDSALKHMTALEQPPEGVVKTDWIRDALASKLDENRRLDELRPEYGPLVARARDGLETTEQALISADILNDIAEMVTPQVLAQLVQETACFEPSEREAELDRYLTAADFLKENTGSIDFNFGLLKSRKEKQSDDYGGQSIPTVSHRLLVELNHDYVGHPWERAKIQWVQEDGKPYGRLAAPVVLRRTRPDQLRLVCKFEVKGKWRRGWPTAWPEPEPSEVNIQKADWRRHPSSKEGYIYTFPIKIPVKEPKRENQKLEIKVTIEDRDKKTLLAEKKLEWSEVVQTSSGLEFKWPQKLSPEYVVDHPIGPQKKVDWISTRVEEGSSFAVAAPRRFGKSTLVQYIQKKFEEDEWLVPQPIACTSYQKGDGIDYAALWHSVARELQESTGAYMYRDGDDLPDAGGVRTVLEAAKRKQKKGVLLLFDEAQLLFARNGGYKFGDLMKDRLERSWRIEGIEFVVGLVGLPTMQSRMGTNLSSFVDTKEYLEVDESDLNALILAFTKNVLQTTQEARRELSKAAENLFLMRQCIDSVCDRLKDEERTWANYDDVRVVVEKLKADLKNGEGKNIGNYVRDVLNAAESVNEWRPRREYPVALALATALETQERSPEKIKQKTLEALQAWCAEYSDGKSGAQRLTFSCDHISTQIKALQEERVLEKLSFRQPLLQAWLVGQCRNGYPSDAKKVLVASAYTTIQIPDGAEPVGEGGEAKVYKFQTEDEFTKAVRIQPLPDDRSRERFIEAAKVLELLCKGSHRADPGAQYIYHLEAVGFQEGSETNAAQLYRWVDGEDLSTKEGRLPPESIIDLGDKLAQAVKLLHKRNVLHRDIRPSNIILEHSEKYPVLIDFGMALFLRDGMKTQLVSDYAAPEVQGQEPEWTEAADVYSLGVTLQALLEQRDEEAGELERLLARMTERAPQDRPKASELCDKFKELSQERNVQKRKEDYWCEIEKIMGEEDRKWLSDLLDALKSRLKSFALGGYDTFELFAEVADLMNQVCEAHPSAGEKQSHSLAKIKESAPASADDELFKHVDRAHQARNWGAHGKSGSGKKSKKEARETLLRKWEMSPDQLSEDDCAQLVDSARRVAEEIGQRLELKNLPKLVTFLMET